MKKIRNILVITMIILMTVLAVNSYAVGIIKNCRVDVDGKDSTITIGQDKVTIDISIDDLETEKMIDFYYNDIWLGISGSINYDENIFENPQLTIIGTDWEESDYEEVNNIQEGLFAASTEKQLQTEEINVEIPPVGGSSSSSSSSSSSTIIMHSQSLHISNEKILRITLDIKDGIDEESTEIEISGEVLVGYDDDSNPYEKTLTYTFEKPETPAKKDANIQLTPESGTAISGTEVKGLFKITTASDGAITTTLVKADTDEVDTEGADVILNDDNTVDLKAKKKGTYKIKVETAETEEYNAGVEYFSLTITDEDKTVAQDPIPQTGSTAVAATILTLIGALAIGGYVRYRSIKTK